MLKLNVNGSVGDDEAGRLHAGQRAHARQRLAPELVAALRRVAHHVGIERDRGEAARLESDVGALRRAEAAQQQAGHDQQHRRQRDLADDQRIAQRQAAAGRPCPPAPRRADRRPGLAPRP